MNSNFCTINNIIKNSYNSSLMHYRQRSILLFRSYISNITSKPINSYYLTEDELKDYNCAQLDQILQSYNPENKEVFNKAAIEWIWKNSAGFRDTFCGIE